MKLSDLINFDHIQTMVEANYKAAGMPTGIIDAEDGEIFAGVGWQDICTGFHRKNPESARRCKESDLFLTNQIKDGTPCAYKCKNGMRDIGIPILVDRAHLATLFLGQFFYDNEVPDRDFFIRQAKRFRYNLNGYLSALDRVPVFSREKVENVLEYNSGLAKFIGDLASKNKRLKDEIGTRRQTEKELEKTRNHIKNIIDSMPSVLIGVDLTGRIIQWNHVAERVTGITAAAAQGQPLPDLFPQMASHMNKINESIRTREIKQENKTPRHIENEVRYEDVTIYPLVSSGVEGAVIRIDDVTDKVRMEEVMIQSEKMLSLGGLAAGMAHEINNPLAGIMQTANVMTNRLTNENIPANRRAAEELGIGMDDIKMFLKKRGILNMLTTIHASGKRISEIVDNMLNFARKSDTRLSSHLLSVLMDKSLELAATDYDLKKHYDFKRIEIKKEYEDKEPFVLCEGAMIQQVLLNILSNGAHAMQEAETENPLFIIRVRFEKERQMVCVEIEDNGPGMDQATRKRVFEPFFTTKPTGVGTGLGLSVSYFIITENHGGDMTVESHPGSGAKFIIRLPLAQSSV